MLWLRSPPMYFEDLTLLHYHSGVFDAASWHAPLLAVGWLEHPQPYPQGHLPTDFLTKIEAMIERAKATQTNVHFRGLHDCSLCETSGGGKKRLPDSYVNVFVPSSTVVYVAPAGIVHYIRHHAYLPPDDFVVAVNRCPEYGTPDFFEALRAANRHQKIPLKDPEEQKEESRIFRERLQKIVEARRQEAT